MWYILHNIPLNFYSTYCFSVNVSMISYIDILQWFSVMACILATSKLRLLDHLDTFSSAYLLVFKLESVPRCSRIFHSVMTNSFLGLYFNNKSTIHNPNHDNLNFDILY